ncbi:MAG: hypothetical protein ATN35_01975 [Epulopiscium sp. Nele67-Bin004]|nr:MAG: hypothetical protein ATN35_01975 [Epulopiscium sp. Nele67-Bin004]
MEQIKYKEQERIIVNKQSIDYMEEDIIVRRGLERYMYARQFVYGKVLDIASGVGYGSYLLAKNPDVIKVVGVDKSEKAISIGEANFANEKVTFVLGSPETIKETFDVLCCLETIEHLPNTSILPKLVDDCGIQEIVLSFPHKKTTHYNPHHLWDITQEDVIRLFEKFQCYKTTELHDSTIMNLVRVERNSNKPMLYKEK